MALSGVLSTKVGAHYMLSIEWSASQSETNNTSTITAKMYWQSLDSYGNVNSSAVKDGAIVIDGTTYTFSGSGIANLYPNQKRLLATKSKTVSHDANGNKSFSISGYFNPEVELSGSYYGRVNIASRTFSLDQIARKSTVASMTNFNAGGNFTITLSRASSSFRHTAHIDVMNRDGSWRYITSIDYSTSESSKTTAFNITEHTRVFTALDGRDSAQMRINLVTYSGNTNLGTSTYNGTVRSLGGSIINLSGGQAGGDNQIYNGQTVNFAVTRPLSSYTHRVDLIFPGGFRPSIDNIGATGSWTPTSSDIASINSEIGTTKRSVTIIVRTYTYFNSVLVGTYRDSSATFHILPDSSKPTFSISGITARDINSTTSTVTGDSSFIIQNRSNLRIAIPAASRATANDGATMVSYTASINGVSKTVNYSTGDVNIDFGTVNATANVIATITARDSRGLTSTVSLTVKLIAYSPPTLVGIARRRNGFEASSDIGATGGFSSIVVNGSQKNALQTPSGGASPLQYRVRENLQGSAFGAWTTLTYGLSGTTYTANTQTITLDNTKAYVVEFRVGDKISSTTVTKSINTGRPLMFIDAVKNSVGIGMFPRSEKALYTQGEIHVGNPTNETEEIFLGFLNDQPRIRVGGTSRPFQVQHFGDAVIFEADRYGNGRLPGTLKIGAAQATLSESNNELYFNGRGVTTYEVPPTPPSYLNKWEGYYNPAYMKTSFGLVVFRGMIRRGEIGTAAFTLPSSCRPVADQLLYAPMANGNHCRINVSSTTGLFEVVSVSGGNTFDNAWVNLNGLCFPTA